MSTATIPSPPELTTLSIEIEGEIGTLTLNRPDSLNAMSPELIFELTVASGWLADQAPLRGLVVTGAGERAFSSGGDVNWFKSGVDDPELDLPANVRRGAEVLHQAIVDFRRIPYPVIGAVNGVAAGAGFSLALMCDIRIASEAAAFVCAYGRIGASPDGGMTYFLPRVVGPAKALELLLNDPLLSAEAALELGIVSKVVAPDELLDEARAKAREAGRQGSALRADGEAADRREPRQLAHRAPPGRAPRDRRLDGDRGPPRGRDRLLRGPRGAGSPAGETRVGLVPRRKDRADEEACSPAHRCSPWPPSASPPAAAMTTSPRPARRPPRRRRPPSQGASVVA